MELFSIVEKAVNGTILPELYVSSENELRLLIGSRTQFFKCLEYLYTVCYFQDHKKRLAGVVQNIYTTTILRLSK